MAADSEVIHVAGRDVTITNPGKVYFPNVQNPHTNIADKLEGIGKSWRAYDEGNGPTSCDATKTSNATPPDKA